MTAMPDCPSKKKHTHTLQWPPGLCGRDGPNSMDALAWNKRLTWCVACVFVVHPRTCFSYALLNLLKSGHVKNTFYGQFLSIIEIGSLDVLTVPLRFRLVWLMLRHICPESSVIVGIVGIFGIVCNRPESSGTILRPTGIFQYCRIWIVQIQYPIVVIIQNRPTLSESSEFSESGIERSFGTIGFFGIVGIVWNCWIMSRIVQNLLVPSELLKPFRILGFVGIIRNCRIYLNYRKRSERISDRRYFPSRFCRNGRYHPQTSDLSEFPK